MNRIKPMEDRILAFVIALLHGSSDRMLQMWDKYECVLSFDVGYTNLRIGCGTNVNLVLSFADVARL